MKTHLALAFALSALPVWGQTYTPPERPLETKAVIGAKPASAESTLPPIELIQSRPNLSSSRWSGRVKADLDEWATDVLSWDDDLVNRVERAAATILLNYQADRDFERAFGQMAVLWVRTSRGGTYFDRDALERVHRLRYQVLAAAGRWEEFDRVTDPLPSFDLIRFFVSNASSAGNLSMNGLLESFEAAPAMIALRKQSHEDRGAANPAPKTADEAAIQAYIEQHFGTAGPELRDLAQDALYGNSIGRLQSMGPKAAGVIASCVLAQLAGPTGGEEWDRTEEANSFELLVRLDQPRALRLFVDWFERASTTWRGQAYSTRGYVKLNWLPVSPGNADDELVGGKLWDPTWVELLRLFLLEPTLAERAVRDVNDLAGQDGISVELAEALGSILRSSNRSLAGSALGALDIGLRVPSAIPALVAGTKSSMLEIRRACAWQLVDWAAFTEARDLAPATDPELRRAAAKAMGKLATTIHALGGQHANVAFTMPLGERDLQRVEQLLRDPEASVRKEMEAIVNIDLERSHGYLRPEEGALEAMLHAQDTRLRQLGLRFIQADDSAQSLAWIRELMSDPDPVVRKAMVDRWLHSDAWTEDQRIVILSAAVVDSDPGVRAAADHHLWSLPTSENGSTINYGDVRLFSAILPVRQTVTTATPFFAIDPRATWADFGLRWRLDPAYTPFLLEFGIDFGLVDLVAQQLDVLTSRGDLVTGKGLEVLHDLSLERRFAVRQLPVEEVTPAKFGNSGEDLLSCLDRAALMEPFDLELMEKGLAIPGPKPEWLLSVLKARYGPEGRDAFKQQVFLDSSFSPELRAAAGMYLDFDSIDGGLAAFWDLLESADEEDIGLMTWIGSLVSYQTNSNQILIEACDRLRSAGAVNALGERAFRSNQEGAHEAAVVLVRRLVGPEDFPNGAGRTLTAALQALEEGGIDEETEGLIIKAALSRSFAANAIDVMGSVPKERFMHTLFELTDKGAGQLASRAAEALGNYTSDEAYEGLKSRLYNVSSGTRSSMLKSMEKIQKVRKLLAGFDETPLPDHDEALAELVELLDADLPAARAAAARGLGSFGAIEALPRLIRMLSTEKDPVVLKAINAAIEMLTAAPAEEGE